MIAFLVNSKSCFDFHSGNRREHMIELEEPGKFRGEADPGPVCPHCETELTKIYMAEIKGWGFSADATYITARPAARCSVSPTAKASGWVEGSPPAIGGRLHLLRCFSSISPTLTFRRSSPAGHGLGGIGRDSASVTTMLTSLPGEANRQARRRPCRSTCPARPGLRR